jgi:hypothetical protein
MSLFSNLEFLLDDREIGSSSKGLGGSRSRSPLNRRGEGGRNVFENLYENGR